MAGDHTNNDSTGPGTTTLQVAVTEIRHLQAQMAAIEREKVAERVRAHRAAEQGNDEEIVESQPLAQALWDTQVQ
ncbi:hypothetical protein A2U01_0066632, partial [Trifolium medium]|nr:hypothetical protein [Trifolium medium]